MTRLLTALALAAALLVAPTSTSPADAATKWRVKVRSAGQATVGEPVRIRVTVSTAGIRPPSTGRVAIYAWKGKRRAVFRGLTVREARTGVEIRPFKRPGRVKVRAVFKSGLPPNSYVPIARGGSDTASIRIRRVR